MIDAIDGMCKVWGAQKRYMCFSTAQGWDGQSLMMKFKEMHDAAGSGTQRVNQFREEAHTGEGLMIARALHGAPEKIRMVVSMHYVFDARTKVKAGVMKVSVPEYWRELDRAHYWIAARIQSEAA